MPPDLFNQANFDMQRNIVALNKVSLEFRYGKNFGYPENFVIIKLISYSANALSIIRRFLNSSKALRAYRGYTATRIQRMQYIYLLFNLILKLLFIETGNVIWQQ